MATYYISPTGNDITGSGTIGSPWVSLTKVWTVVAAGDTVYLRGGTYTLSTQWYLNGTSGTAGNRINILAYPGESPVITRASSISKPYFYKGMVVQDSVNYLYWKGIRFTGMYTSDGQVDAGLQMYLSGYTTCEMCEFDHNVYGCYCQGPVTGNYWYRCDFHDNYEPTLSGGGTLMEWL